MAIQQSVYVIPNVPLAARKLRQLRDLIEENAGDTLWLDVVQFSQWSSEWIVGRFNEERTQEYDLFTTACSEFDFDAPIQQCQAKLEQLRKRYRKLAARDYFDCSERELAHEAMEDVARKVDLASHSS